MNYILPNPIKSENKKINLTRTFVKFIIETSVLAVITLITLSIFNQNNYNKVYLTIVIVDLAALCVLFLKDIIQKLFNSTLFISISISIILALIWIAEGEKTNDIFAYISIILFVGLMFGWKRKILSTLEIILACTGILGTIVFAFYRLLQLFKIM